MEEMKQIFRIFEKYKEKTDFVGPVSDSAIEQAENRLGVKFPQDYRFFLKKCGAGSFGGCEIYGIVPDDTIASVPNGIWATEYLRAQSMVPDHCVVFAFDGFDGYYCMDTTENAGKEECPVLLVRPGQTEQAEEGFAKFLLKQLKQEIDDLF
jgi:hypothetical protein